MKVLLNRFPSLDAGSREDLLLMLIVVPRRLGEP